MTNNLKLALVGFAQLTFLSANTFYISQKNYMMIVISAMFTNIVFSYAVKMLAFSGWKSRLTYSVGCTFGCLLGTFLASLL